MAFHTSFIVFLLTSLILSILVLRSYSVEINYKNNTSDVDLVEFALNLEYLETEFFLHGALGVGMDVVAPGLSEGGPSPVGGKLANLSLTVKDIIREFGLQEIGHFRAIKRTVKGFPRPLLNISKDVFAKAIDDAFGQRLNPPFDPYANDINYLLASYFIPYVGLTGYVGAIPLLQSSEIKQLVAGLLGVESGQDAVTRTYLYERKDEKVTPYGFTVAEFTNKISELRNRLGNNGTKDEGLVALPLQGAEGRITGNVLSANQDSVSFARTPLEILRIVYGSGDEHFPGGFYPKGAHGNIARSFLNTPPPPTP